jgi:hypothetical protein
MLPPKRIGRFFLLAVIIYAALMTPWPGVQRGYAWAFRTGANVVFTHFWFWPDGRVRFFDLRSPEVEADIRAAVAGLPPQYSPPRPEGVKDTLMILMNRGVPEIGQLRTSSRYVGYGPTVVIVALVLATPLPWRRRLWALLWGLVWIHVFIVLRVTLTLTAAGFAAEKAYALFTPSPFWRSVLVRLESLVSDNPTVSFVVPAFIWFLVALRHVKRRNPSGATEPDGAE